MKTWWRIRARYHQRRAQAICRGVDTVGQYETALHHFRQAEKFFAMIKGRKK